jgi:hypothetical protein
MGRHGARLLSDITQYSVAEIEKIRQNLDLGTFCLLEG